MSCCGVVVGPRVASISLVDNIKHSTYVPVQVLFKNVSKPIITGDCLGAHIIG